MVHYTNRCCALCKYCRTIAHDHLIICAFNYDSQSHTLPLAHTTTVFSFKCNRFLCGMGKSKSVSLCDVSALQRATRSMQTALVRMHLPPKLSTTCTSRCRRPNVTRAFEVWLYPQKQFLHLNNSIASARRLVKEREKTKFD